VAGLTTPVTLDEVQHVPELFPAIKAAVDRRREPGRFLLTGSANVLLLPKLSESLAGRMEVLTLGPFSQGEMSGVCEGFIDALFAKQPVWPSGKAAGLRRDELFGKVLAHGRGPGSGPGPGGRRGPARGRGSESERHAQRGRCARFAGTGEHRRQALDSRRGALSGTEVIPFAGNLHGLPLPLLWAAHK